MEHIHTHTHTQLLAYLLTCLLAYLLTCSLIHKRNGEGAKRERERETERDSEGGAIIAQHCYFADMTSVSFLTYGEREREIVA